MYYVELEVDYLDYSEKCGFQVDYSELQVDYGALLELHYLDYAKSFGLKVNYYILEIDFLDYSESSGLQVLRITSGIFRIRTKVRRIIWIKVY